MRIPFEHLSLALVLGTSLLLAYNGLLQDADYLLPSFDNALLHTGRVHYVYDTGFWIPHELVFGGATPSYHVPAYASFTAALAHLTGLNYLWAVRLVALVFSLLLPLGFYLLGKHLGNGQAGVAAAFFAINSNHLMTWGTRTSAISLGVILVVFGLYFLATRQKIPLFLTASILAMTHPPSLLVFFGTSGLYGLFLAFRKGFDVKKVMEFITGLPLLGAMTGFLAYMAWHVRLTGTECLTFKCLPQLGAREYGQSVDLVAKLTAFPYGLGLLGVGWIVFSRQDFEKKALIAAWLIGTLILVKNDLLGIGVFTERFVTFFEEALAVSAGLFVGLVFEKVGNQTKPGTSLHVH